MLHFFTDPYEDELIYSAIARYHYYTGNIDYKDTLKECFGKTTLIPSFEIGSNLEALAKNLGRRYTSDYLINKHTIFPFYAPFLAIKRKQQILKEIKNKDGKGIYTSLGIIAGSICVKSGIYYCPLCVRADAESYGEAYIHREHQLQGISLCHRHEIMLNKYPISKLDTSRLEYIRLDKALISQAEEKSEKHKYKEKMIKIAKDAYFLMQVDLSDVCKEKVHRKYIKLLSERGLISTNGRVKQRDLYEEFTAFYGNEFLSLMESDIEFDNEFNWLKAVTRNEAKLVHPIRQLMLINFLQEDIEKFFYETNYRSYPFGKGPWPCLNKAAEHYGKRVVITLEIKADYKTRVPVGTFTCSCGFIYSRKGPDKMETDRYKIGRIKAFGEVWENKLKQLLISKNYGVREIAKLMSCDAKTAIKYASKLGLLSSINTQLEGKYTSENKSSNKSAELEEPYKKDIEEFLKANKTATRQQLRNSLKKQYIWLYRHDRAWLEEKLPEAISREIRNKNEKEKVNWKKRDLQLVAMLEAKRIEMLSKAKPVRITKSSLGKAIGQLATLEKKLDKLPETKKYIEEKTESVEQFQIRRCKGIIAATIDNKEAVVLWKVQRVAGIRTEEFEKLKSELERYIKDKRYGGKQ